MKSSKTILTITVGILLTVILFYILPDSSEDGFKKVQIPEENNIMNESFPTYYDTILQVGMSEMGIEYQSVIVGKLSDKAKNSFDGELMAHVRYDGTIFYLFIENLSRDEAIDVISHEIIHMDQYLSDNLIYESGIVTWKGVDYLIEQQKYDERPWETDAFDRELELSEKIRSKIW